jgi:hypothetical protein
MGNSSYRLSRFQAAGLCPDNSAPVPAAAVIAVTRAISSMLHCNIHSPGSINTLKGMSYAALAFQSDSNR